jgi:uncharacterized protein YdhG (YjbR/CyaY superfamily)
MSRYNAAEPKNTDEYIAMQPDGFRPALHELRALIMSVVPQAEESISYQVPCFKYHYMLVGIGVNKKFVSFYTMSPGLVKKIKDELNGIKISGTTLHFLPDEPIPIELIKNIVLVRVKENESKEMAKRKK